MLRRTPLYDFLAKRGARMVDYAGWQMPLQFEGVSALEAARHARSSVSLFDVSHMCKTIIRGREAGKCLEDVAPMEVGKMQENTCHYSVLLNDHGGIIDDVIVSREAEETFQMVSNAATVDRIRRLLREQQAKYDVSVMENDDALVALQGPGAMECLVRAQLSEQTATVLPSLAFMHKCRLESVVGDSRMVLTVARCGYTGEDGFEIECPAQQVAALGQQLVQQPTVQLAGLVSRDILRLEAGLCLAGRDFDETITPIEAGLKFVIAKGRLEAGARRRFPGFERIVDQMRSGVGRRRVGFVIEGHAPIPRPGTPILSSTTIVGHITSGTFSPQLHKNIAMGYLSAEDPLALDSLVARCKDRPLGISLRGQTYPLQLARLPFVPHRYYRP